METKAFFSPWRRLLAVALGVAGLLYASGDILGGSERGLWPVAAILLPAFAASVLMVAYGQRHVRVGTWPARGAVVGLAVLFAAVLRATSNESTASLVGRGLLGFLAGLLISGAFVVRG